jgi:hypothetical protein
VLVFAVAGVVLWQVLGRRRGSRPRSTSSRPINHFRDTFNAMDITTEEGAKKLVAYADENKDIWKDLDQLGTQVIGRTAKAKDFLGQLEAKKELLGRLDEIEQVMAKAAELPPSDLAEQLRRMDELKTKAGLVGPEFEARLDKDISEGERALERSPRPRPRPRRTRSTARL